MNPNPHGYYSDSFPLHYNGNSLNIFFFFCLFVFFVVVVVVVVVAISWADPAAYGGSQARG